MIRILTLLLLALAATPASAAGPGFSISGASMVGIPGLPELSVVAGARCRAAGRARIVVTFADPDGVTYAAVDMSAVPVRPAVSDRAETWLWLPPYARPARGYQWRFEDTETPPVSLSIPIEIELVPGARPISTEIMAKDGNGAMTIRTFALVPDDCR